MIVVRLSLLMYSSGKSVLMSRPLVDNKAVLFVEYSFVVLNKHLVSTFSRNSFLEYFEKCGALLLVCPLVAPFLGMKSSFEADTLLSLSDMSGIILLWSTLGHVVSLILIFLLS